MSVRKAVVLARGLGTRMRAAGGETLTAAQAAAADAGAKAMMPIGRRPFLDYVLSALADAGCRGACLVVAPEHEEIRDYYGRVAPPRRLTVDFVVQPEPRGTADAVAAAEAWTRGDQFLVVNGDNYYPVAALAALRELARAATVLFRPEALVSRGNIPAERVRAFALCRIDDDGFLASIVEKPPAVDAAGAAPALVSMNCWLMPPQIHEACRAIDPSVRGEIELADAVTWIGRERGVRFAALVSEEGVLDLSRRSDVASVARLLEGVSADP